MALIRILVVVLVTIGFLSGCKEKPREKKQVTKDMLLEMNKKMVSAEVKVIEQYIADNHLDMTKSGTGYYYQINKPGVGDSIRYQDAVKLAYTTSLLDGTICYSSATDGFMQFTVGKAQVEAGLEQFVQHLQQGAIAKLILPPYLAHGIAGDGNKIPKLAIIVMDIEVLEVQTSQSLP
ncbi:FKBP-type peptidyl-prolyl cis-trans isomerase [Carboxylicivirga mesophila]|uniref:Peptidyl-prolyl cis-trans isomerase n=1 Tax=Carboxylicivirga mesophila TaxID=1166478 RepID=A0ABS5K7R2_9BACT|nr:FKBP-type peptidyl-prolyl cis-trans isomerase [Carboxylicivirga mesophila]MBS2210942.1 FKBP-type peptidyl-prolyl cis-trans isomerase [Carboxylicivirga mesophila]